MLTIFTIPYKFEGIYKIRQENAVQSWKRLCKPEPEIIFFCNDEGVKEAAERFGCVYVPDIGRNQWGTPLVNEAFMKAQEMAKYDVMAWLNADILVNEAWAKAVLVLAEQFPQFLAVGQRWDTPSIDKPLNFGGDWWTEVLTHVKASGKLHSPGGIDNFAFRRGMYTEMPPFAVGKSSWDNWLVADPVNKRYPVINITAACTIVHQGMEKSKIITEERQANRKLAGQKLATVKNANWVMGADFKLTLPVKTKAGVAAGRPSLKSQKPMDIKPKIGKTGKLTVISIRPLVVQWDFVNPLTSSMGPKNTHVGYGVTFAGGKEVQGKRAVTNVPKELKPGAGFQVKMTPPTNWPPGEYCLHFDFRHGGRWGSQMGFVPLALMFKITARGQVLVR